MNDNVQFHTVEIDKVIDGYVVTGVTSYRLALDSFVPLIGRLDMQRDALRTKFYNRLEADIIQGCVMPPITVAMIHPFVEGQDPNKSEIFQFINNQIKNGFVLDGIQRLTTLVRASPHPDFDETRSLHVNFVLAPSRDRLLYRMITLNNGQKPMSARHQIDVLADAFFDFDELNINLVAEKGNGRVRAPDAFKKADFVKGYIAYLSNSVSIDNQKIIEEKMDELIASRIIDSDIATSKVEFSDVVELINKFGSEPRLKDWIRVQNNFIGFCVGIKCSLLSFQEANVSQIAESIESFERAFSSIDVSKVNLGKVRRESVSKFVENYEKVRHLDELSLLDKISDWI